MVAGYYFQRPLLFSKISARDRNRTDTPLPAADFESAASTNSATRAIPTLN